MTTAKDYRNDIRPNWCPGCGHYGVQAAITDAVVAKNIPPEKLAVISGIGCSSRIGGYFYAYGAHTTMVVRFLTHKVLNLLTKILKLSHSPVMAMRSLSVWVIPFMLSNVM